MKRVTAWWRRKKCRNAMAAAELAAMYVRVYGTQPVPKSR